MNDDDLVAGYLGRLVRAARPLPADRRAELIDEIADHIEEARAASATSGPGMSDLLLRLGEPEAIVAAASDSPGDFPRSGEQPAYPALRPSAVAGSRRPRWLDVAAVLLTLGGVLLSAVSFVLALLGWAVGIVMLLLSPRWPNRAKVLGAVTGTLALVLFGHLLGSFAKEWNRFYWQPAGPFGWQANPGVFVSAILVTGAIVAATLVGVRLLRYPRSRQDETSEATPGRRGSSGPPSPAAPEPAASVRAS
jgi:uncharacterized membrane protein